MKNLAQAKELMIGCAWPKEQARKVAPKSRGTTRRKAMLSLKNKQEEFMKRRHKSHNKEPRSSRSVKGRPQIPHHERRHTRHPGPMEEQIMELLKRLSSEHVSMEGEGICDKEQEKDRPWLAYGGTLTP